MQILASWDDGAVEDLKLADLLVKYNIKSIFFWPAVPNETVNMSKVKKMLTLQQMIKLAETFEVGSHTVYHNFLTKVSSEAARREVFNSRHLWQKYVNQPINAFCYPRGYANDEIKAFVKEAGYTWARNTFIGEIGVCPDPFWTNTTAHVGINRQEYNGKSWLEYTLEMLERARNIENSIFHIFGHSWEIEREQGWVDLETLFKAMQ